MSLRFLLALLRWQWRRLTCRHERTAVFSLAPGFKVVTCTRCGRALPWVKR